MRRTAVEDEVDAVAELVEDLGGVARLGQPGDIRGGRRQRPDAARQRPGSVVVRHAQADRRRAAGQGGRAARRPAGAGRRRVSPPGQNASRESASPPAPITADRRRLRGVVEQQHDPLVGRPLFHLEQSLDAARRLERDRDPVDRVGRQRDDPAGAQDLDRPPPDRASSGTTRAVTPRPTAVPGEPRRRRCAARFRDSASPLAAPRPGDARTSASIIRATPSSASGGAM